MFWNKLLEIIEYNHGMRDIELKTMKCNYGGGQNNSENYGI